MKILIADSLSIIQDSIKKILPSLSVRADVDEVSDGTDALRRVESGEYDIAILGDQIPGINGIGILEHIKGKKGKTRMFIFTEHPKGQTAYQAFKLGASGYLSMFSAFNVLDMALHDIASGDGYEIPES